MTEAHVRERLVQEATRQRDDPGVEPAINALTTMYTPPRHKTKA